MRRLLLLLVVVATVAAAQIAPPEEIRDDTPRHAMRAYLLAARAGDWARAAGYLDLRALPPPEREARGAGLAQQLKSALDRTLWVDLDTLSDAPGGDADDGRPARIDVVGTVAARHGPVEILLERRVDASGVGRWRVAAPTVAAIPAMYEEFGRSWLEEQLPAALVERTLVGGRPWQWLGLLALLFLAPVLAALVTRLALGLVGWVWHRVQPSFDGAVVRTATGPVRLLLAAWLVETGSRPLALPVPLARATHAGVLVALGVGVTWLLLRATDVVARSLEWRLATQGGAGATALAPLARRVAKAVLSLLALVTVLQTAGIDVTGLVAGLGVGGIAIALAAQKTVENLFGGFTLAVDQPVRVGDFCRFGDRVGTVEDIGLRSTRVRTLDRTVVTVPNAEFATMQLENIAARDRIRLAATLGLRYETTPDQLRCVLVELKKLLLSHPLIDPEPARVRFANFGAYSLDVEVFAYVLTSDINEFHAVREDLFLRIMDVLAAAGTGFAFPSQTNYPSTEGFDPERAEAAAARARAWRASGRDPLPHLPADEAEAVRGTLPYRPRSR